MSHKPSIAEFIATDKRKRYDEVQQLSDVPGYSHVDLSIVDDDGDDIDNEKSNPEPPSKKKEKRIALREQFPLPKEVEVCTTSRSALLTHFPAFPI